jgi:GNAT superfamily N-acetyltransferase
MKCDIENGSIIVNNKLLAMEAYNKDKQVIAKADLSNLKTDKTFIWLHHLEVVPECRDKGVGTEVLEKIAELGKAYGASIIYAYPAQPIDAEAPIPDDKITHFYKKNGFVACKAPKDAITVTDEGLKKSGLCRKI